MKRLTLLILTLILFPVIKNFSQSNLRLDDFEAFRTSVANLSPSGLQHMYPRPSEAYYKGFSIPLNSNEALYLDSAIIKLGLTEGELNLLKQNRFFVSERMSFNSFGDAFYNVYSKDLPVFVTTDAILFALHKSYDEILKTLEREIMGSNLEIFLQSLFDNIQGLFDKYGQNEKLSQPLHDVALYITVANSLIKDKLQLGLPVDEVKLTEIWNDINAKQMNSVSLFANHLRNIDFSQFTVRGHYVFSADDQMRNLKSLEPYFRTMMWLGRIDFFLTPPPKNPSEPDWTEEDIQRMNFGAFLLNELFQSSNKLSLFLQNEQIINYLVGESDNILPSEYQGILDSLGINSAGQLLDETIYTAYKNALTNNPEFEQEILSDFFIMNPDSDKPDELPISFRLSGQRFILDSYILGNMVYDRLIVNGHKIMRMIPHPFDALFALGNNDVLPLLEDELTRYPYSGQLATMRFLVDSKANNFWEGSLYNVWLNSIRCLNPKQNETQPLFMKTAAWHQEKINTQLASWAQLRHDNLLYAKQSYTGGTMCSYPFSYVEPYTEFYKCIKQFAQNAEIFFYQLPQVRYSVVKIVDCFRNFADVSGKLEILANKELENAEFSSDEKRWLKSMLYKEPQECGTPPFSGWYPHLFYEPNRSNESDYTIADIHTQPTDEFGNPIGKVMHVGTGKINLGVFIADCPGSRNPMVFVGPVMSYYQTETESFKRLTDQEWTGFVLNDKLSGCPDWTNIYLADKFGETRTKGAELPSKLYTSIKKEISVFASPVTVSVFPNPFHDQFGVQLLLKNKAQISFSLFNSGGILIQNIPDVEFLGGLNSFNINIKQQSPGIYFLKVDVEGHKSQGLKLFKQ
jgi:hypothetical protein